MSNQTQQRTLRVDQIGSLVVPRELKVAHDRHARGELDDGALREAEDRAIQDVVRKQQEIGLPIITDGEFRRRNFQESFSAAVSGFEVPPNAARLTGWQEPNRPLHRTEQNFEAPGPAVVTRRPTAARLHLERNVALDEYRYCAAVATNPVKVSIIGPDRISQRFAWERSQSVYKDMDAFIADVVAIERQLIQQLVDAGCRYIHMDAPGFTAYVDPRSLGRMRARGEDPDENLDRAIRAENAVIAGFEGVTFGLHICRGNPRGVDPKTGKVVAQWHREGHYDAIAERLFTGLDHQRLLLEYDSPRAGDFAPLRFVRHDTIVVLGLVTTKDGELETADALKHRLDEASRYVPFERLAVSPQCGFSSGVGNVQMTENEQWAKFERLIEVARSVFGDMS